MQKKFKNERYRQIYEILEKTELDGHSLKPNRPTVGTVQYEKPSNCVRIEE